MELKLGIYKHFKGKEYKLISIAKNSENLEDMVVYQALYGERIVWVRPLVLFIEKIERDGYKGLRFTWIREKE
jgi:hypothetical protein